MATVIPAIDPAVLQEEGDRRVYLAARNLPEDYTVLYSYKFCNQVTGAVMWEADLVVIHPLKGFLVYKVHRGEVGFFNGRWHELRGETYVPLEENPVELARRSSYAIVRSYQEKYRHFPLSWDFGLCFPDCRRVGGEVPVFARPDNLVLNADLENFSARVAAVFRRMPQEKSSAAVIEKLINQVLTVNFRLYNTLEDQIRAFGQRMEDKFTTEQQRIIEETELNKRMVFYGAAGTGKTLLAVEKARRLAGQGKRVLLTCFNRHLAAQFPRGVENLTAIHFHGVLEMVTGLKPPPDPAQSGQFFEHALPEAGREYFSSLSASGKFQSLVVDEGQDFRPHWFPCLEAMVDPAGEFYVFADPNQNIFNVSLRGVEALPASRFRLTTNLRNTTAVCRQWIEPLGGLNMRLGLQDAGAVHFHSWQSEDQQRELLGQELARLVKQGVQPRRITILSPNRRQKTCLAGQEKVARWPLAEVGDPRPNAVRFSTIRAFKGLEADVVMLIGIRPDSPVCSRADLYVGGSRARYMLHVFHRHDWQLERGGK